MQMLLDWKSLGSLIATLMFIRTAIRDFLPPEVYQALRNFISKFFSTLKPKQSVIIEEELNNGYLNEVYESIQTYLSSKCISSAQTLKAFKPRNSKNLIFSLDVNQNLEETFDGFKVKWCFYTSEKKSSNHGGYPRVNRYFVLEFDSKFKEKVHSFYLPHVIEQAEIIKFNSQERKLYTNKMGCDDKRWSHVPFTHPSTFDTLAMNPLLKEEIKNDLLKFVNQKEFYNRVGKTWKRGYLLYGPPGTGKTSLIAAIANFLHFDIYDLELTSVDNNSQLKKLLISTSSKSVIVIEDIDCSLDLTDRKKKDSHGVNDEMQVRGGATNRISSSTVNLSGVLNFIDGLWSSCGGERLIIFTTNYKENLDEALVRPGRMDKHINLSYCDIYAFKMLAMNYLHVEHHELMKEVEEILPLAKMTPAEIAELFMCSVDNAEMGMNNAVKMMKERVQVVDLKKENALNQLSG